MKRFQMITEADARVIEYGSTVTLVAGGHVTPLAADTLKARRVSVIRESGDADEASLAPPGEIRTVAIGGDHTSVKLKAAIVAHLRARGIAVHDLGTDSSEPVDYPDTAGAVALQVARGEADAGIVIDGTGIGSAVAANKIPGIRAAMAMSETVARHSREQAGANVLTLGALLVTADEAKAIVSAWLTTPMVDPAHVRRLAGIRDLEKQ